MRETMLTSNPCQSFRGLAVLECPIGEARILAVGGPAGGFLELPDAFVDFAAKVNECGGGLLSGRASDALGNQIKS